MSLSWNVIFCCNIGLSCCFSNFYRKTVDNKHNYLCIILCWSSVECESQTRETDRSYIWKIQCTCFFSMQKCSAVSVSFNDKLWFLYECQLCILDASSCSVISISEISWIPFPGVICNLDMVCLHLDYELYWSFIIKPLCFSQWEPYCTNVLGSCLASEKLIFGQALLHIIGSISSILQYLGIWNWFLFPSLHNWNVFTILLPQSSS